MYIYFFLFNFLFIYLFIRNRLQPPQKLAGTSFWFKKFEAI